MDSSYVDIPGSIPKLSQTKGSCKAMDKTWRVLLIFVLVFGCGISSHSKEKKRTHIYHTFAMRGWIQCNVTLDDTKQFVLIFPPPFPKEKEANEKAVTRVARRLENVALGVKTKKAYFGWLDAWHASSISMSFTVYNVAWSDQLGHCTLVFCCLCDNEIQGSSLIIAIGSVRSKQNKSCSSSLSYWSVVCIGSLYLSLK